MAGRAHAMFDPYELLGSLQGRNVSFVVIGAFARVVHGTRELTDGIDISASMREENVTRLENALEDLDARRADGQPLDLRNLEQPVVELETRAGELKLVPEPAGTRGYDDLRRRADREPLGRGASPPDRLRRRPRAHARRPRPRTRRRTTPPPPPPHEPRAQPQPRARPQPRHRDLTPTMTSRVQQLPTPIAGETQMHHDANTRHSLCTMSVCHAAVSGARPRKHSDTHNRSTGRQPHRLRSPARRHTSSG